MTRVRRGIARPASRQCADASTEARIARSLAVNALAGAVIGPAMLALLVALDPLGLRALLASDDHGILLTIVMGLQFSVGFAVFSAATGLFLLDKA